MCTLDASRPRRWRNRLGFRNVDGRKEANTTERTYNEEEFAALLKRAAELQSGAETRGELTLRDVEQIAEAAGIEARYVREAAGTPRPVAATESSVLGPAARVQVTGSERASLNQQQLSDVLEEVRRITGRQGVVNGVLDALEWRAAGPLGATYVTVRQRNDEVRVTVLSNRTDAKITIYMMSGLAGMAVGAVTLAAIHNAGAPIAALGSLATGIGAALAIGRTIWSTNARRFREHIDRLYNGVMLQITKIRETTPP